MRQSVSQIDFGRLIDLMYRCVDDPAQVSEFLGELCLATRCHNGSIQIQDLEHSSGRIQALIGPSVTPEAMLAYETRYAGENVLMQRAAPHVAQGRVLYSDVLIGFDELRNTRYWREYMREMDVDHCVGLFGLVDHAHVVVASLNFSDRRGLFDKKDRALLEALTPHWVNVCRLQRKFGLLQLEAGTLRKALDRLDTAVFFLDMRGQVCGSNAAAEHALTGGQLFYLRHARLIPCWHADVAPLQRAINAAVDASGYGDIAPVSSLVLRDSHGEPHAVANICALPLGTVSSHPCAGAALFLRNVHVAPGSLLGPLLQTAYGLTPAESRLAVAFAVDGNLDRAATECGLTDLTARSRIKQIFAKTGVHGQAGLMHLLGRWCAAERVHG